MASACSLRGAAARGRSAADTRALALLPSIFPPAASTPLSPCPPSPFVAPPPTLLDPAPCCTSGSSSNRSSSRSFNTSSTGSSSSTSSINSSICSTSSTSSTLRISRATGSRSNRCSNTSTPVRPWAAAAAAAASGGGGSIFSISRTTDSSSISSRGSTGGASLRRLKCSSSSISSVSSISSRGSSGGAQPRGDHDDVEYHRVADATLHSLQEQLDFVVDSAPGAEAFDCDYADGVVTLRLGPHGIFVINKQAPNRQLWLSSPVSGPARYEWDAQASQWVNVRDRGVELFGLLQREIAALLGDSLKVALLSPWGE